MIKPVKAIDLQSPDDRIVESQSPKQGGSHRNGHQGNGDKKKRKQENNFFFPVEIEMFSYLLSLWLELE